MRAEQEVGYLEQNKQILRRSQALRRNMTKEERHLWYDFLKTYPTQFKRQYPIGPYFAEFFCYQAKLIIDWTGRSITRRKKQNEIANAQLFWSSKAYPSCGFPTEM